MIPMFILRIKRSRRERMNKIKKLSRLVRYYLGLHVVVGIVAHFVAHVHEFTWTIANKTGAYFKTLYELNQKTVDIFTLPTWQRMLVSLASFPSILLEALGFYSLMCLLRYYERDIYFNGETARLFKRVGIFMGFAELAKVLERLPVSFSLSFMNPPGERMISLSLSNHNVTAIMLSLTIVLVGWVMERGATLQQDVDGTI